MEIINNIAYIAYRELVKSDDNPLGVMSERIYKKLAFETKELRKTRSCYGSPVMIEFDSLPFKYRERWISIHGDPKKSSEQKSFTARITPDIKAREYYTTYCFNNDPNQTIKPERIEQYCNDAAMLNTIKSEIEEMTIRRSKSGTRATGYWEAAVTKVETARAMYEPCGLPKTAITLKRKYERYIAEGYDALIHRGNGNQHSAAIQDEVAKSFLFELLSHGNQHSVPQVVKVYNVWARANDRRELTDRTVVNFRIKYDYEISCFRQGGKVWADKYDKVMHRERPSAPLLLINSDDNDLDLYFKAEYTKMRKGKLVHIKTPFYRFKLYVVVDAYCDYILGYAYGHEITKEVVRDAYRNAMSHVRELTGGYHLWHQIVTDRWGLDKEFRKFFERQAIFTPPTVGNARSKIVERSFGQEWHNSLKMYNNYAGNNITAQSKRNEEWIKEHQADFPNYEDGELIVKQHIERMRQAQWKQTGKSRQQVWIENYQTNTSAQERPISRETYLSLFGETHSHQNRLTNRGIEITIDHERYTYDIPDAIYSDVVGRKAQVIYDPSDMDSILVTDGNKMRFVAEKYKLNKMAIYDQTDADRAIIDSRMRAKKEHKEQVVDKREQRVALTYRKGIDSESYLQSGDLIKEKVFSATSEYGRGKSGEDEDFEDENFLTSIYRKSTHRTTAQN